MPTSTSNYALQKPLVNDATDEDLWGGELNDDLDSLDTLLRVGITIAPQSSQTTGFTATSSISVKYLYPCDATAAGFTATIPAAATAGSGATVFIKKTDATSNIITLARSASDTLDGATSLTIETQNSAYGLVSDGVSKWFSICKPSQAIPDASTTVKGIIEIATDAEALAGSDTTRAVTSAGLASSKSLATSGYMKLPGGLIMQWGITSPGTSGSVTFPTAFSSAAYFIGLSNDQTNNGGYVSSRNTTGFSWSILSSAAINWFAVGV